MKVTVVGAGAVGGYFGGRLAASGNDVAFLARGRHLEALRDAGLRVQSVQGDLSLRVTVTDDPTRVGPTDYVLFCVKAYDTESASSLLPPLLAEDTAVISLQNGIDNEDILASVVGSDHVVGGVAYIYSTLAEPGVIRHTGGPTSVVVGELQGGASERVSRFIEGCLRAGFSAEQSVDIRSVLWSKFACICAMGGLTAAIRLPVGDVRSTPSSRELFRRVVAEVGEVARAEGVDLGDDLPDRHLALADGLEPHGFSSLYHDLINGNRMELDPLLGAAVRRGAAAGVSTPMCQALYAVLEPWARHNQGQG